VLILNITSGIAELSQEDYLGGAGLRVPSPEAAARKFSNQGQGWGHGEHGFRGGERGGLHGGFGGGRAR